MESPILSTGVLRLQHACMHTQEAFLSERDGFLHGEKH